jgi:hypothetical protein
MHFLETKDRREISMEEKLDLRLLALASIVRLSWVCFWAKLVFWCL